MKTWTKPTILVVNMNAEIGGYQPDFDDGPDALKRRAEQTGGDAGTEPPAPERVATPAPHPGRPA